MNRLNLAVGGLFGLIGIYLLVSARQLPPGVGPLPGPGFFPLVLGAAITLLAALLLGSALRDSAGAAFALQNRRALILATLLIAAHLLGWGLIPFAPRTAVILTLFLIAMGERWRASIAVSVILTAVVTLLFQYGLRVSLG